MPHQIVNTYRVVTLDRNGNPERYETSDGKYWIAKSPSTLMNTSNGRVIKYGNFTRRYTNERSINVKQMAVANKNGNNNANKNANKTRATRKNRKNRRSTRKN